MDDFVADLPQLAPAGTDQRIRDRIADWGFELEPSRQVGDDLLVARARPVKTEQFVMKGKTVGMSFLTGFSDIYERTRLQILRDDAEQLAKAPVIEVGDVGDWYLFADPMITDRPLEASLRDIDWKVINDGMGGVAVPERLSDRLRWLWETPEPAVRASDPYAFDLSQIRFSMQFKVQMFNGLATVCDCRSCRPDLYVLDEPPEWEPTRPWTGY